jgi:hypothetical protein
MLKPGLAGLIPGDEPVATPSVGNLNVGGVGRPMGATGPGAAPTSEGAFVIGLTFGEFGMDIPSLGALNHVSFLVQRGRPYKPGTIVTVPLTRNGWAKNWNGTRHD